ncbi:MAG: hypothetical protein AAF399_10235 [Bacteroidota bacterium]
MHRLPSMILLGLWLGCLSLQAQSPHGDQLNLDCALCHDASGWSVDLDEVEFDHSTTIFELEGTHARTDCKLCHQSLVFDEAPLDCASCHTDVHSMLVGNDCARCHDSEDWLVDNIPELHEENGFPLYGAHANLACVECHINETNLRFDRLGNECINCHLDDFEATSKPNHVQLNFDMDCAACHTPDIAWTPAEFLEHDALFFPVYSGSHQNTWSDCNECHQNPSNFAEFTCTTCHGPETDDEHNGVAGYVYESLACLACHPDGSEDGAFDHDQTNFPLVGLHLGLSCLECHANGFVGTSTDCFACHEPDYQAALDPNHVNNRFPTDCASCHTENGWEPADFDHDGMYFPIYSGTHEGKWDDCTECHQNSSNFADFTCITCHRQGPTASRHLNVPDYVYESNACLSCHPTGE